jgi:hypothetical protein
MSCQDADCTVATDRVQRRIFFCKHVSALYSDMDSEEFTDQVSERSFSRPLLMERENVERR